MKVKVFNSQTLSEVKELNLALATRIQGECIVGRSPNAGLVIDSPDVSRLHGKFLYQDGDYYFYDIGSRNGSIVNGYLAQTNQSYKLKAGDVIRIGEFVLTIEEINSVPEELPETVYKSLDATVFSGLREAANLDIYKIPNQPQEAVNEVSELVIAVPEISETSNPDVQPVKSTTDISDVISFEEITSFQEVTFIQTQEAESEVIAQTPEIMSEVFETTYIQSPELSEEITVFQVSTESYQPVEEITVFQVDTESYQPAEEITVFQLSTETSQPAEEITVFQVNSETYQATEEPTVSEITTQTNQPTVSEVSTETYQATKEPIVSEITIQTSQLTEELTISENTSSIPEVVSDLTTIETPPEDTYLQPVEGLETTGYVNAIALAEKEAVSQVTHTSTIDLAITPAEDVAVCAQAPAEESEIEAIAQTSDVKSPNLASLQTPVNETPQISSIISTKYVALIAHESKKSDLAKFVAKHQEFFLQSLTLAPPSISQILIQELNISISLQIPATTSGGYQTIASMVALGDILAVILLKDFMMAQSSQANEEALLRVCNINEVLVATNIPTAEAIVHYIQFNFNSRSPTSHF